jgi:FkbM family methyltransferase
MLDLFSVYKNYPYRVPPRVRFFNLFRYFFTIPTLENILVARILKGKTSFKKAIPPFYFYERGTIRYAQRGGINYALDISCLIDHAIYYCNTTQLSSEILFKLVRPNFIVVDIGANIGYTTLNFARICNNGSVYCFEPDSDNYRKLQENIGRNNFPNVNALQIAVGSTSESKTLSKIEKHNPGANRILPTDTHANYDSERVTVRTLDEVANELSIQKIDLIKIDVEGFELFVLKGALHVISKHHPILFVELSEVNLKAHGISTADLVGFIEKLGYEIKDAQTMRPFQKTGQDQHTDIVCFHRTNKSN